MGKTADNERIKLQATYYNNISVGLYLAGCILPMLTALTKAANFGVWLDGLLQGDKVPSTIELLALAAAIIGISIAFYYARRFRNRADKELTKLQD